MSTKNALYIIECPHCACLVEIEQVNCQIFRHGAYKKNLKQIPPHLPKEKCIELATTNQIYGCGKPFRFDGHNVSICDYI